MRAVAGRGRAVAHKPSCRSIDTDRKSNSVQCSHKPPSLPPSPHLSPPQLQSMNVRKLLALGRLPPPPKKEDIDQEKEGCPGAQAAEQERLVELSPFCRRKPRPSSASDAGNEDAVHGIL